MTEQLREQIAEYLYDENEPTLNYDGVTFEKCKDIYPDKVVSYLEQAAQILALTEIAKALEYYRIMHSPGHDVEKYYKEG